MNDTLKPILIVEDRHTDLDLTKRALRQQVLNPVQEARDGEEALIWMSGVRF